MRNYWRELLEKLGPFEPLEQPTRVFVPPALFRLFGGDRVYICEPAMRDDQVLVVEPSGSVHYFTHDGVNLAVP